jgi:glycosyltransferase involved in cell wall biosynthesis
MRNILLLIKGLGRGGAEQILVSSARLGDWSRFAYSVAYLLPWKNAFVRELEDAGVPVTCLDEGKDFRWMGDLRRLVVEGGIDLVHAHSPLPAIGARLSLRSSVPIVYTEHNDWERYNRSTYWGNLLTYRRNRHVFAVSEHVRSSVQYPSGLRFLRMPIVETLYHGPDPVTVSAATSDGDPRLEFRIPPGAPVVGTVANLKRHKGHEYLLSAAVEIRRILPDTRFILVGTGPLEHDLKRLAERLGIGDAIIFTGFREDAVRIASCFDVFVLASIQEGLSIALIEAMLLGKPAVVTRVGGLPEVVEDGRQGFVVPASDPGALASRIVTLLRDRRLLDAFGTEARRRAGEFQIVNAVKRIETVYEELLG